MSNPTPPMPPTSGKQKPSQSPKRTPKQSNSSKIWLIVGSSLIVLLLITAALLYFLTDLFDSRDKYDYDDGDRNEKVLRDNKEDDSEQELKKDVHRSGDTDTVPATSTVHKSQILSGHGMNGEAAISMDLNIDNNGHVSGTYWNVLYCLEFSVSGTLQSDGSLDLTLTTVKDHVSTHLQLTSTNGYDYVGYWGKQSKPVSVALYDGSMVQKSAPAEYRGHVSGPNNSKILNQDFIISEENGNYFFWYPTQGYQSRLKMDWDDFQITLYSRTGMPQARIDIEDAYEGQFTGTMYDNAGQSFPISFHS